MEAALWEDQQQGGVCPLGVLPFPRPLELGLAFLFVPRLWGHCWNSTVEVRDADTLQCASVLETEDPSQPQYQVPCWETLGDEGKTGAEKANQEMAEIIPPAVNDLSQGGKGGLRREEWNITELRKGGNRSKRSYWT